MKNVIKWHNYMKKLFEVNCREKKTSELNKSNLSSYNKTSNEI